MSGERSCPVCRHAVERDQEYCLECGARLPSPWGERKPPPLWVWVALAALALVALVSGVIVAVLATHDEDPVAAVVTQAPIGVSGTSTTTAAASVPAPAAPVEPPASIPETIPIGPSDTSTDPLLPTVSTIDGSGDLTDPFGESDFGESDFGESDFGDTDFGESDFGSDTETETDTGSGETDGDGLVDWPSGQNGFTVVLASVPESRGESAARSEATAAAASGLGEVGVLRSSDFSNLNPDFWVVFAGIYSSLDDARAALSSAQSAGYETAYTRRITP